VAAPQRGTVTPAACSGRARLPPSCWLLATLVAVGVAAEVCLVYFGAELLTAAGLRIAQAATAMSGFYSASWAAASAPPGSPAAPAGTSRCCGHPWRSPPPGS
jgi:hypothetical protein